MVSIDLTLFYLHKVNCVLLVTSLYCYCSVFNNNQSFYFTDQKPQVLPPGRATIQNGSHFVVVTCLCLAEFELLLYNYISHICMLYIAVV